MTNQPPPTQKKPIRTVFNSILIPFLWDHKHFSKRREKKRSLHLPHNLSTFPPRCSLRLDISQANHQFLFVLHCLEKPSGKRKEKEKKYNPDDMSCTSWHSCHRSPPFPYNVCVGGIYMRVIHLTGNFLGTDLFTIHSETRDHLESALTTAKLSIECSSSNIPSSRQASQGIGPELGAIKRQAFKVPWKMQSVPQRRVWSQPIRS